MKLWILSLKEGLKVNKLIFLIVILLIYNLPIFTEEINNENKEIIKSLEEERLETIKYGISTQVTDLIKILE